MKHGKKYTESVKAFDLTKPYEAAEAIGIMLETAKAKFDETVEMHVRLGVDPRQADQQVRGVLVLPNGTGKTKKVLVIAKGAKADQAAAAGADYRQNPERELVRFRRHDHHARYDGYGRTYR